MFFQDFIFRRGPIKRDASGLSWGPGENLGGRLGGSGRSPCPPGKCSAFSAATDPPPWRADQADLIRQNRAIGGTTLPTAKHHTTDGDQAEQSHRRRLGHRGYGPGDAE